MDKTKIIIACIIAVVVVVGAFALASGLRNFHESKSSINVTGLAEKQITSDLITWDITIKAESADRVTAFNQYEHDAKNLRNYLKQQGIADNEITTASVQMVKTTESYYDASNNYVTRHKGYMASQTFTVRSNKVTQVETVYNKIAELYNRGIDFSSDSPKYYYTKLNDLKMEMLKEASANAYERAKTLAQGSEAGVGELLESSQGVFQIVGLNTSDDYSWGGTFNTSSKQKVASITVRATYRVK